MMGCVMTLNLKDYIYFENSKDFLDSEHFINQNNFKGLTDFKDFGFK